MPEKNDSVCTAESGPMTLKNNDTEVKKSDKLKEIARFTKKRTSKKKLVLIIAAVAAAAGIITYTVMPKDTRPVVDVSPLEKGELVNRINLSGTVSSDSTARIYSNETGIVRALHVKVGDRVEQGDILCELDTTDIERSIAIKQKEIQLSAQKNALSLEDSTRNYQNLLDDMQNDNYTELITAQQTLNYAQRDFADARRALDDHEDEQDYADEVINKLEREMHLARIELSRAKKNYNEAVKNNTGVAEAYAAMQEADNKYAEAFAKWDDANDEYGDEVTKYTDDYRQARLKYNDALENKELAERNAARSLAALKNAMERDTLNSDMTADTLELEKLQKSFEDSTVKAPISGTITAVYALEGMPGSGLLFVIENTDDLVVKTAVREYDIAMVKAGLNAVIKSDATGDKEFDGEVLRVAPAAQKDKDGSTQESSNVKFETDVAVKTPESGLRIGMNVRLNIILEKKEGVLSVPFDAVITDENGADSVLVARAGEDGKYIAQPVAVTTGMETDFSIEIESSELKEGDLIITMPAGIEPGSEIKLSQPVEVVGQNGSIEAADTL